MRGFFCPIVTTFEQQTPSMAALSNQLSWSISRLDLFGYCKRKYYFTYYESWEGWLYNAPERKRMAYFLKNRPQAVPWVGEVVHNAIKYTILNFEKATPSFIRDSLVKRLTADYKQSLAYTKSTAKPKDRWFLEHYRGETIDLEDCIEKGLTCIDHFFNSFLLDEIKWSAETANILYLDEADIEKMLFKMGEIPTYAIPDLCFRREDGSIVLIDWKTGKSKEEELTLQLKLYANRLVLLDGIDVAQDLVEGYAFYLAEDELKGRQVVGEDIIEINELAIRSFENMKTVLEDIPRNKPLPEEFFEKTTQENKCKSCAFREICLP